MSHASWAFPGAMVLMEERSGTNGLPFRLNLALLFGEKRFPIPSTRSLNMSHSEASADSFDLVESALVTEEDALAAQEESERLRNQP